MLLTLYTPYPGCCLVVTPVGSVLLGAPSDAFRATKAYCNTHALPFPNTFVAPSVLMMHHRPQYNIEFFLYDFLFIQGAAYKPHMAHQKLQLVLDAQDAPRVQNALRTALLGPYNLQEPAPAHMCAELRECIHVGQHLAVRRGSSIRPLEDMLNMAVFNHQHKVWVLDGFLEITRTSATAFALRWGNTHAACDLALPAAPMPLCPPQAAQEPCKPLPFGVTALGGRSGFDPSGPTTGFVLWIDQQPVLLDGPSGIDVFLRAHHIQEKHITHMVLSHCHDDHIGAAIEMVSRRYPWTLVTSQPVYESFLTIAASYLQEDTPSLRARVPFQEIQPHQETCLHGASASFFYTAHSIPALGVSIQYTPAPKAHPHQLLISGDSLDCEHLDTLLHQNILSQERHHFLKNLVPPKNQPHSTFFIDTGEAEIHGKPSDWTHNPNNLVYYHCPSSERMNQYPHPVIQPGKTYSI
jgi:hypothetical protein